MRKIWKAWICRPRSFRFVEENRKPLKVFMKENMKTDVLRPLITTQKFWKVFQMKMFKVIWKDVSILRNEVIIKG